MALARSAARRARKPFAEIAVATPSPQMRSSPPRSRSVSRRSLLGRPAAAGVAQRRRSRVGDRVGLGRRRRRQILVERPRLLGGPAPRAGIEHLVDEDAPVERDRQHVAGLDHVGGLVDLVAVDAHAAGDCTSFAASERDLTTRAKNSHLSMRWRPSAIALLLRAGRARPRAWRRANPDRCAPARSSRGLRPGTPACRLRPVAGDRSPAPAVGRPASLRAVGRAVALRLVGGPGL